MHLLPSLRVCCLLLLLQLTSSTPLPSSDISTTSQPPENRTTPLHHQLHPRGTHTRTWDPARLTTTLHPVVFLPALPGTAPDLTNRHYVQLYTGGRRRGTSCAGHTVGWFVNLPKVDSEREKIQPGYVPYGARREDPMRVEEGVQGLGREEWRLATVAEEEEGEEGNGFADVVGNGKTSGCITFDTIRSEWYGVNSVKLARGDPYMPRTQALFWGNAGCEGEPMTAAHISPKDTTHCTIAPRDGAPWRSMRIWYGSQFVLPTDYGAGTISLQSEMEKMWQMQGQVMEDLVRHAPDPARARKHWEKNRKKMSQRVEREKEDWEVEQRRREEARKKQEAKELAEWRKEMGKKKKQFGVVGAYYYGGPDPDPHHKYFSPWPVGDYNGLITIDDELKRPPGYKPGLTPGSIFFEMPGSGVVRKGNETMPQGSSPPAANADEEGGEDPVADTELDDEVDAPSENSLGDEADSESLNGSEEPDAEDYQQDEILEGPAGNWTRRSVWKREVKRLQD